MKNPTATSVTQSAAKRFYMQSGRSALTVVGRVVTASLALAVVLGPLSALAEEPKTIKNSIGMKLVRVPVGKFMMGSPRNEVERDSKEERHEVEISKPFYIGAYEVTQAQYSAVTGENRSTFKNSKDNPAENVEWKKANAFCSKLSSLSKEKAAGRKYRLPTEAEWEYACRGGTKTAFQFGNSLSSRDVNFNGNYPAGNADKGPYLRRTAKVGSYKPNALGLYDMHGNVAEWCADWYDPEYYLDSPEQDPLGPPLGVVATKFDNYPNKNFFVVVRGGCWADDGRACRSAYRYRAMPNTQYRLIGFRIVCEATGE